MTAIMTVMAVFIIFLAIFAPPFRDFFVKYVCSGGFLGTYPCFFNNSNGSMFSAAAIISSLFKLGSVFPSGFYYNPNFK